MASTVINSSFNFKSMSLLTTLSIRLLNGLFVTGSAFRRPSIFTTKACKESTDDLPELMALFIWLSVGVGHFPVTFFSLFSSLATAIAPAVFYEEENK